MKKLFIALLLLAALGSGAFYFIINKPHKDVNDEKGLEISAAQLFAEFTANEQIANPKYLNKAIQVTGIIVSIDENQDKQKFIVLKTDDEFNGVMCTMKTKEFTAAIGDHISVKGFCSGFVGDVKLTDCVVITEKK